MTRLYSTLRISFGLTVVAMCVLLMLASLGVFPDPREDKLHSRISLCETVAVNCSVFVGQRRFEAAEQVLGMLVERNSEIQSVGLRRENGELLFSHGDHEGPWAATRAAGGDGCLAVPILSGERTWGEVEIRFTPLYAGMDKYMNPFLLRFVCLAVPLCGLLFTFHLRRVLTHLNPARVVPHRVREALDTLTEGIVLLDGRERIALANQAFAAHAGVSAESLLGKSVADLQWQSSAEDAPLDLPWRQTTTQHVAQAGGSLALVGGENVRRVFLVNSTPVLDEGGKYRGTLASFSDVTELEERKSELLNLLQVLRTSRDEIRQQNTELQYLATRDPLTSCLNRRTFFQQFESHWDAATRHGLPLACVMVDIDFFKAINDNHGHAAGDDVLRKTGEALMASAGESDVVCRYGGEEFCVLMPRQDIRQASEAAEKIRSTLGALKFEKLSITASLGVSAVGLGASCPQDLLEQADKCLYVAKRNGRNQVVRFDAVPADLVVDEKLVSRTRPTGEASPAAGIPIHAVNALLSALAYRDADTAAHSTRVADLAAMLARRYLPAAEAHVVEVAALLHDIGKIGVPDAILLKPDKLTAEEWQVMAMHDRFGVEIINSSFQCPALTDIVRTHHAMYGGDASKPHLPQGEQIPLGARIVSITDAYDAMVSDRPYRRGRSPAEAIAELRRCVGRQFDGKLVEEFASLMEHRVAESASGQQQISREAALNIGLQIERIVSALDAQDLPGVKMLVGRLQGTAQRCRVPQIAEAAQAIAKLNCDEDADLIAIVQATSQLVELCRSTHGQVLQDLSGVPAS